MTDILVSLHGNRIGLSAAGALIIDGSAATFGVNFANGTAAAPAVSFAADSDLGLYRVSANILAVVAGSSQESVRFGSGAITLNNGAADIDFTAKKLTSGNWLAYDAGTDALLVNAATIGVAGAITASGGNVIFNNGAGDYDFTIKKNTSGNAAVYDAGLDTLTIGAVSTSFGTNAVVRTGRKIVTPVCGNAKVGATAGWVITAGTDKYSATLPASQTASTLVIPINGLEVGDTLTAVDVIGQVESGGNAVVITMDVRKLTAAAADLTDASLATDSLGAGVTADTILSSANLGVTGLTEVIAADETVYVLLTATTLGSTDIDIMSIVATVTKS